jgi:hypothetical protein
MPLTVIQVHEKFALSFDETYYALCKAISNPLLENPNQYKKARQS